MGVNSRLLIKHIEARPALWNRDDKDYCHKQVVSKLWAEIAVIHGVHESQVKNKWKALRDTFRQELKKNPQQSPWNYYMDMQFLKGQLKTLPLSTTKPECEEEQQQQQNHHQYEEMTFVKTEPEDATNPFPEEEEEEGIEGKEYRNEDTSRMEVQEEMGGRGRRASKEDDDYHFLMSLLPEMRKLEPRQKILLRIKMLELFYKEAYKQQL